MQGDVERWNLNPVLVPENPLFPTEAFIGLLALGLLVVLLIGFAVWYVQAMRRALTEQSKAAKNVDVSVEMQRRSLELQEKAMTMSEQSLKSQEEMNRLLLQLLQRSDQGVFPRS